jgi:hypothetical protein
MKRVKASIYKIALRPSWGWTAPGTARNGAADLYWEVSPTPHIILYIKYFRYDGVYCS